MKRILALSCSALMLCTALAFAGCDPDNTGGGNGGNGGNNGNGGNGSGVGGVDASVEGIVFDEGSGELYKDTKDNKTAIKITYSSGNGHEWIRRSAREFLQAEEGKDYYFELNIDDNATSSMSSKLEGKDGLSDIYYLLASPWQSYASLGQLENLDDVYAATIPGEEGTVLDKVSDSWKTYGKTVCQGEEHYYIFPQATNVTGIVYNKTMFDEWGWEVPETVAEFTALCDKIASDTKGKIKPIVYPGTVAGGYWDFVGTNWWLQVSGVEKLNEFMQFDSAEVFNPDVKTSPSYGKYLMLRTFQKTFVENKTTYILPSSASYTHYQAQQAFGLGQAAMIPNGNWIQNESGEDIEDEIRMMPVPLMEGALEDEAGNPIHYNYTGQPDFIAIPSYAQNKEGAKAFLAYMSRDDMLKTFTEVSGTPRPFNYDISECRVSDFAKSCLDVWSNSISWFEQSTSPLWTGLKIKKFNAVNPYTGMLTSYPKVTASSWCASEYSGVKGSWDTF